MYKLKIGINDCVDIPHAFMGTNCYFINKRGADKFVKAIENNKIDAQVDSYLSGLALDNEINIYMCKNRPIEPVYGGYSDIQISLTETDGINPFQYKHHDLTL